MKLYKRLAIFSLSLLTAAAVSAATAFAEPSDIDPEPDNNTPSYVETAPIPDVPNSQPDLPSSSAAPVQPDNSAAPDQGYQAPPAVDNTPSYDYGGNAGEVQNGNQNSNQNVLDNYQSNAGEYSSAGENSAPDNSNEAGINYGSETDPNLDNKLYNAGETPGENNMDEDDWKSVLDFNSSGSGDDFSFIKNNKSSDDSVLYQLMLYGGVLLIVIGIAGIILIIIMTVKAHKRNKLYLRKASGGKTQTENSADDTIDISKSDTGEIDIDLSKYDKYL